MNKRLIFVAILIGVALLNSCSESNPCKTEIQYLNWETYEIAEGDSIITFYAHVVKVLELQVNKSISIDTVFTSADTIYNDNDTTYIAADTSYISDTTVSYSSAQLALYHIDNQKDTSIINLMPYNTIEYGEVNEGKKYNHIIIYCDEISADTSFIRLKIQNTEIFQDCSAW